jgi:PKD repeat protein
LTAIVLPVEPSLSGQTITNYAELDFDFLSETVWVESGVVTPELSIRLPDGTEPADPLLDCDGTVSLIAFSNRAGSLAFDWDFGDGSFGSGSVVTHTYASLGLYLVTLTSTNAYGWVETDTLAVEVSLVPVAGFLSNSPVDLGQPAVFTDVSSSDPTTWFWDFGDGVGTSDQQNPVYTYTSPGFYTVTLVVTNVCGLDTFADGFEVLDVCEGVEEVTVDGPAALELGEIGLYTATYVPLTATPPVTLSWDNGTIGENAAYSWTVPGTYTVTVTATNACGQAVDTFLVQVYCLEIEEVLVTGPLSLDMGQLGLYTATYVPITATAPVTLSWDNGAIGSGAAYSWTTPGTYTITVVATGPCNQVTGTLVVEVQPVVQEYRIYLPLISRS